MRHTRPFMTTLISTITVMMMAAFPAAAATASPLEVRQGPTSIAQRYEVLINGVPYEPAGFSASLVPSCSASDPETKHIVAYQRRRPDGVAVLLCGSSAFGWRHIAERHGKDWQNIVTKYALGGSWEDFARWAIEGTVGQPVSAPEKPNGTWTYTGFIQIRQYNSNAVAKSYTATVPVSMDNDRIVIAHPS